MIKFFKGDQRPYLVKKKSFKDQKMSAFCNFSSKNAEGEKLFCNFQMRLNHLKNKIKKNQLHECNLISKKDIDILDLLSIKTEKKSHDISKNNILDNLCDLAGKIDLSLDQAASEQFYEFIQQCVYYGINISYISEDPEHYFNSAFPKFSRSTFRRYFIERSHQVYRTKMKNFSELNYNSCAIDEGTTRKTKYLDFVLHNTYKKTGEYIASTEVMNSGNANEYSEIINQGLSQIIKYEIKISTIVIYGNLAQKKALDRSWSGSVQSKTTNNELKKLIIFPCLCHRINNAYKHTYNNSQDLKKIVDEIRNISFILQDEKSLSFLCLNFINTRWIYDFDILIYIYENKVEIENILQKKNITLNKYIFEILDLLTILKSLIQIFESSNQSISSAYPILESSLKVLNDCQEKSKYPGIYHCLQKSVKKYTIKSKEGGLLLLSYFLTPKGIKDISNCRRVIKGELKDFYVKKTRLPQKFKEILFIWG